MFLGSFWHTKINDANLKSFSSINYVLAKFVTFSDEENLNFHDAIQKTKSLDWLTNFFNVNKVSLKFGLAIYNTRPETTWRRLTETFASNKTLDK